ncbi:hypothetical protein C5B42_05740 [Candidatus Cerribacteria bacterium 'Amazon FNV 2010 28 9']|uniref:Uncharacterized protein n=1 Tax=Candidatus Cerribacteria bacterium 'Amazon FNV 2010 28 9' TaxID=2081795 RepID=A0A317JLN0_9BACT|nr:MAG: hypothetical protein C5B42_05740 [Candidatus Cerribacteria bacterium 'Amazon FNV 2010 28 9']
MAKGIGVGIGYAACAIAAALILILGHGDNNSLQCGLGTVLLIAAFITAWAGGPELMDALGRLL